MGMTVCVLASGSAGNSIYIAGDSTAVLVDAGISARELGRRLETIGVAPETLRAVCLTHEHGDHIAGMRVIHKRLGLGVYANAGTSECLDRSPDTRGMPWQIFSNGSPFSVGDLQILPFSVPHDAYDPVGFIVSCGAIRVGVVTDMGIVTELIRQRLSGCQVLVVEANHDERMVADAKRPWYLKQRILGRQGHLSNRNAAELVAAVGGPHLRAVFLAHLSSECNRPELAREVIEEKLRECNMTHVRVVLTYPDKVSEVWRE